MIRARRIVPPGTPSTYDQAALTETAEVDLHAVLVKVRYEIDGMTDLEQFTDATGDLTTAVAEFFDQTFVMAEDKDVRATRLGLLASVAELGVSVLAWDQLRL